MKNNKYPTKYITTVNDIAVRNETLFPPPPNVKTAAHIVTTKPWTNTNGTGTSCLLTSVSFLGNNPFLAAAYIPSEGPTTHELTSAITPKANNNATILVIQSKLLPKFTTTNWWNVWTTPALRFNWSAGITAATVKPPTVLRTIANTTSINIANG